MPSFGALNWDDECKQLNAAAAFSENSFAAGLEEFGRLTGSWEDELDELSSGDTVYTQPTPEDPCTVPETDMSTKPGSTELFALEDGPGGVIFSSPPVIVRSPAPVSVNNSTFQNETTQQTAAEQLSNMPPVQTPILDFPAAEYFSGHPGWSLEESPSLSEDSATSPEVCAWAMTSAIFQDMRWIIDSSTHGASQLDIPRIASCLLRAIYHVYPVPMDGTVRYPYKAWGEKDHYLSYGANVRFPRGAKGLKEANDPDVPKEFYIPNGMKKGALRSKATNLGVNFYPQPSRLSKVETISYGDGVEAPENSVSPQSQQKIEITQKSLPFSLLSRDNFMENQEIEIVDTGIVEELIDGEHMDDSSFEEKIEAQFELEIDDSSFLTHVVDEDTAFFYDTNEESSSTDIAPLSSNDPIDTSDEDNASDTSNTSNTSFEEFVLFDEDGGLDAANIDSLQDLIDDTCDHTAFGHAHSERLSDIPTTFRWTASSFALVHHGPRLIVRADCGYASNESDYDTEFDYTAYAHDDCTNEIDGEDIDEALAHLDSLSIASVEDLEPRIAGADETYTTTVGKDANTTTCGPVFVNSSITDTAGVNKPMNCVYITTGLGNALGSGVEELIPSTHEPKLTLMYPLKEATTTSVGFFSVVSALASTVSNLMSVNPFSVSLF